MKILLLGVHGQVGSELVSQLRNGSRPFTSHCRVLFASRQDVDLSKYDDLKAFLRLHNPDWIINAAAHTAVDKAESEKALAFSVNREAVGCIAAFCTSSGARLIHISTDYVFAGGGDVPFVETDPTGPLGVYGRSKLAGEEQIRAKLRCHVILRTAWVFGVNGNNFVKSMLRLAKEKAHIDIVGDQIGGPTSATAIANAILVILSQMQTADESDQRWGTYHFSGYPFVSWADFAREIFGQAMTRDIISNPPVVKSISSKEYPTPAARPSNSRLDCSKILRNFELMPDNWRESLGYMLDRVENT